MEVWGPKRPAGWRYPASERTVRAALAAVPDLKVRFDSSANPAGLVAVASFWSPVRTWDKVPYLTIHAQRESEYPPEAAQDFAAAVLPAAGRYFLDRLALKGPAAEFDRKSFVVTWDGTRHVQSFEPHN